MIFAQKVLAPGPGTRSKATFGAVPILIRFDRSLLFKPPVLPEVMTERGKGSR